MKRRWVESGIVDELDKRQERFLKRVLFEIGSHYRETSRPLNLFILARRCHSSHSQILLAIRFLANSVNADETRPPIFYTRTPTKIGYKKRYNIFLTSS